MHITDKVIDINRMMAASHREQSGAVVLFCGDVRNNNKGLGVHHLEYEAHIPLANKVIATILREATGKWDLDDARCLHRIGKVKIAETAIVVITCAAHRKEAYEANQYILERVKLEAPIWKNEFFVDGTCEWGHNDHSFATSEG